MAQLSDYSGMPELMKDAKHKPFTLIYEQMVFNPSDINDSQLKKKVADLVIDYKPNEHHERIMDSDIKHIMTTNYDYSLELAKEGMSSNLNKEKRYSVFRSRVSGDKRIWHVHGEAEKENSISLGFDQYSGQLQKLRSYATSDKGSPEPKSPFRSGEMDFDEEGKDTPYSWVDVFLRDDIHIIGYSLDYTEFDIWWSLIYKHKPRKAKSHTVGTTTYHDIQSQELSHQQKARNDVLESLGVEVKVHFYKDDDRAPAYKKALDAALI